MKGSWAQAGSGFEKRAPITWNDRDAMVIDKADGRAFSGYQQYTPPGGTPQREVVNGVIAPDGDILVTDEDGFFEGTYSDGMITRQYAETGADNSAVNVTFTKK